MSWKTAMSGGVLGLLALAALLQRGTPVAMFAPCAFNSLTGLYCPGCGSTRAALALVHGHPLIALGWNPLLGLLVPLVAMLLFAKFGVLGAKRVVVQHWAGWITLTSVVAFTVVRNLPWWPFTLLAPGGMLR